jgi:quercetin dioxygenase-like cupin family protein
MKLPPQIITALSGEGKVYALVGDTYTMLADGAQTGGSYALVEACVPPGSGPPPHFHTREEESFYMLEGELSFMVNDRWVEAKPGAFIQMPRGTKHCFKNNGKIRARVLVLVVPSGFDAFLKEAGTPMPARNSPAPPVTQSEIDRLLVVAPKYGIEIVPAPAA